jgi:hypothetical protein
MRKYIRNTSKSHKAINSIHATIISTAQFDGESASTLQICILNG